MILHNPIILCDYSDPDAIRVGKTFYMTASSFNFMPGLPILASEDLSNWRLLNYACKSLPFARYDSVQNACGIWAPSIRFFGGRFYIFFATPDEGIFFVSAENPSDEWTEPKCVFSGKGLEDPCPLWDDDGKIYLVHAYVKSRIGFNSKLGILELDSETLQAKSGDKIIFDGTKTQPTIEGPKFYKRNGFYYIFAPAGGVTDGWQTVLRSKSIFGKWEERIVLKQGSSRINGPHQGAWISCGNSDFFVHFQERGVFGRIVHIQPLKWRSDDWCGIGSAAFNEEICGEPLESFEIADFSDSKTQKIDSIDSIEKNQNAKSAFFDFQFSANAKAEYAEFGAETLRIFAQKKMPLWKTPNAVSKKISNENFDLDFSIDFSSLSGNFGAFFMGNEYRILEISHNQEDFSYKIIEGSGFDDDERVEKIVAEGKIEKSPDAKIAFSFRKITERTGNAGVCLKIGGKIAASTGDFPLEKAHWVGGRFGFYANGTGSVLIKML